MPVGVPRKKAIGGGDLIRVHLEVLRLDVYEDELSLVLTLHARTHHPLEYFIAAPGEFLFAILRLDPRHDLSSETFVSKFHPHCTVNPRYPVCLASDDLIQLSRLLMTVLKKTFRRVSWREGIKSGLRTVWSLGIVIFPMTFVVSVLQYTAVYETLLSALAPAMGVFGLPGGAAVPLVLGNLVGLYAAIGAMLAMELTVKEVFTLALMLSFSHMLPVEAAVCRRVGVSATLVVFVRLALSVVAGLAVGKLWSGGGEIARYGLVAPSEGEPSGWVEISVNAFQIAGVGVLQLALVVIPVMVGIQILKDLGALERFGGLMRPLMRPLGIAPRGAVTMAGGLTFGLAFGAGIIMEQAREQKFTKREITLIVLFLSACHAVVEDTLIFVPLGINVLPLLVIRLAAAILLVVAIARLWPPDEKEKCS